MNNKRRFLAIFFLLVLVITALALPASAAKLKELDTSKYVKEANEFGKAEITFSLPSNLVMDPIKIDIVFVLDGSIIRGRTDMIEKAQQMIEEVSGVGHLDVKVGVISFTQNVTDRLSSIGGGLQPLTEDNKDAIIKSLNFFGGAGSNVYGGILKGKALLDADEEVLPDNKYLIYASDVAGYFSDAGDGKGITQFYRDGTFTSPLKSNEDFWKKYYNNFNDPVTVKQIDALITEAVFLSGVKVSNENEKYLFQTGPEIGEYSRYKTQWTEEERSVLPTFVQSNAHALDFHTMFEKNIYLTGNLFLQMQQAGYQFIGMRVPYQNPEGDYRYFNKTNEAFIQWIDQNISPTFLLTDPDIKPEDVFSEIEEKYINLIGKGKIVDQIADDFLVDEENAPKVTMLGTEIEGEYLGNSSYGFGKQEDGSYSYVYYLITNADGSQSVEWDINRTIYKAELLELTFFIKIKDEVLQGERFVNEENMVSLDTNKEATIYFMDEKEASSGTTEFTYMFSYTLSSINVYIIPIYYVDKDGIQIAKSDILYGYLDMPYEIQSIEIEGYTFTGIKAGSLPERGTFVQDGSYPDMGTSIIFVYDKDKVIEIKPPQSDVSTDSTIPPTQELPIPNTGDNVNSLFIIITIAYAMLILIFVVYRRKQYLNNN